MGAGEEILLFGGEAYDGRELTFYSDIWPADVVAMCGRVLDFESMVQGLGNGVYGPEFRV